MVLEILWTCNCLPLQYIYFVWT